MEPQGAPHVPDELMNRLHEANQHLHEARLGVERAMEGAEYRHQERLDAAEEHLRQVAGEFEQIDQAIKAALQGKTSAEHSPK
jgi:predicted phage gp36 major capsid-like protein